MSPALLAGLAVACLWDHETLKEEALRQKDVAEIVQGRIMKHSPFFYEEKASYTKKKIDAGDAKPEWFDDLAVALHKLGRTDDAIAVMHDKLRRFGEQYTTSSNLGTFLGDKGEYEPAIDLLEKSVQQNPQAHFGREHYQIAILRYLQALAKEPALANEKDAALGLPFKNESALIFADQTKPKWFEAAHLREDVFVALAGLIRFGSADQSPHVWCSLAMALAYHGDRNLALAAFRRAQKLGHPWAHNGMRFLRMTIHESAKPKKDQELDATFEQGQKWVTQQQTKEDAQLRAGKHAQVFGY